MKKMDLPLKNIFLTVSLTFTLVTSRWTPVHCAVFESHGMGARSAALGGGFVSVAGDYESIFWNPAGLGAVKERVFHSNYRNLYGLGILRYMSSGYVQPKVGKGAVGFSWHHLDTTGDASFLDYAENTLVLSYATNVLKPLSLGINGKYYRVNSTLGASGMGLDFGLSYTIKDPYLVFGAAVQDLNRTLISWDSGVKERLPIHVRAGLSGRFFRHTLVVAQIAWKDQADQSHHIGVEQEFFNRVLAIRLGGIERNGSLRFSWGLGLNVKHLRVDYAWEREKFLGDTQVFSASLEF